MKFIKIFLLTINCFLLCAYFANPLLSKDKVSAKIATGTVYLDLDATIGIAMTNNFELKAIKATEKVYILSIREKLRQYFPTLSISYLQTDEVRRRETDTRQHKLTFNSEFMVYDGGRTGLAYDIAKLKSLIARNDYRFALNKLIVDVRSIYLQVLKLKEEIMIHEKTLKRGKMQESFIKKEYELGSATKHAVLEIETKVKEIELNLEQAKDNYKAGLNQLKLLLKIDWRQNIDLKGSIDTLYKSLNITSKLNVNDLVAIALKNRKEIESALVEYKINEKTYRINKLYYFPKFSVGLNYSLEDQKFFPRKSGWGVTFKVSTAFAGNTGKLDSGYNESENRNARAVSNSAGINILDNMEYKRNIVESRIQLETSKQQRKDIKQKVSIEILNAYTELSNSTKMINISKKQLELYDKQLLIERLKANMGESRRYDLMKKEIERGEAAIAFLDSKIKYLTASYALEIALAVDIGFLNQISSGK